jgi:hypothetical protein
MSIYETVEMTEKKADYNLGRRRNAGSGLVVSAAILSMLLISSAFAFNCQPVGCVKPSETICAPITAYSSCCSPSPLFPPPPPVVAPVIICPVQGTFGPPIMVPPPEMISKVKPRNLYASFRPKFPRPAPRVSDQNPAPPSPPTAAPKKK